LQSPALINVWWLDRDAGQIVSQDCHAADAVILQVIM
jgi:hypothetical protein